MPRGKAREKTLLEIACGKNRKVYLRFWRDTGLVDIGLPDRSVPGFHLRHIKGVSVAEAEALLDGLAELKKKGVFKTSP
jgi:hypothetical protein